MDMANIHAIKVRWSKVKIDADKDMNGKSLTNLNEVNAQIFSQQNGIQIIKSPERDSIRIITPTGYMDVGSINSEWAHFYTDRPQFYFDRSVCAYGALFPYINDTFDLGKVDRRWVNAWIGGNLGLGVLKRPGTTLTVDVIFVDAYVEVASKPTETTYDLKSGEDVTDWDIGTLSTYTTNGIITGIKIQIESRSSTDTALYKLYEDGVEILSFYCGHSTTYRVYSAETNTTKKSATYEGRVIKYNDPGTVSIKNRHLYFKKRYLGIKGG